MDRVSNVLWFMTSPCLHAMMDKKSSAVCNGRLRVAVACFATLKQSSFAGCRVEYLQRCGSAGCQFRVQAIQGL
eukprot:scaffold550006_cov40-Prasinocladus_malaysianus.AAC.1